MYYNIKEQLRGMMLPLRYFTMVILLAVMPTFSFAQMNISGDSLQKPLLKVLKKLEISGTIRMRYNSSLEKNVDVTGKHHLTDADSYSTNAFTLPQVRLVASGNITDKLDVYIRANFADFSQNPQNKVLEYAYATYHLTDGLALRAGLFRPEFGREDDIATDFLQSFDYTNQYTAFAENGWMNYQIGVSLLGKAKLAGIPCTYAFGIFNGNGRDGFTDNDNGKQITVRVTTKIIPDLEIGLNSGLGNNKGNSVYAWGIDLDYVKHLGSRFELDVLSEYKEGSNQSLYFSQNLPNQTLDNYKIRGVYALPSLQYKIHSSLVKGIEASFKYEYLDPNYELDSNTRQQYVPMVGIDFAEKYAIRFQVGMMIDHYKTNIENTSQFNSSRFLTQLQLRF